MEVNNLGFNVYREEAGKRVRLNQQLLAGSALMVGPDTALRSGRPYAWTDPSPFSAAARYWIEDVDLNGHASWNGPFYPAQAIGKQRPASVQQAKTLAGLSITEAPSVRQA